MSINCEHPDCIGACYYRPRKPKQALYECGICDCLHPWNFDGDCRDDSNRFGAPEEYAEKIGVAEDEIEIMLWEQRTENDSRTEVHASGR